MRFQQGFAQHWRHTEQHGRLGIRSEFKRAIKMHILRLWRHASSLADRLKKQQLRAVQRLKDAQITPK